MLYQRLNLLRKNISIFRDHEWKVMLLQSYSTRQGQEQKRKTNNNDDSKKSKYTETILLPQTKFPARITGQKRVEMDSYLTKKCGFQDLYNWQRSNLSEPDFILHDGPPYANGMPHMGHVINKVLKDITIRNKVLQKRQRVHYVPGWDCHGLPIELKALNALKAKLDDLTPVQVRQTARKFAAEAVGKQREIFASWGVMADWKHCYFTNDPLYIKNELHQFINLYEKGIAYRDFKPVHWSPSSRTALAESELQYNEKHKSQCATVRFEVHDFAKFNLKDKLTSKKKQIYALIWTTTPWTLVANQAIAYSRNDVYCLSEDGEGNGYIVAVDLIKSIEEKIGPQKILETFRGEDLEGATYYHPITREVLPFLPASHVKMDKGTGLVHTAPAHGAEDFLVALENKISIRSLVDERGRYTSAAGTTFAGLDILKEGNKMVLETIGKDIVATEDLIHSYPYDWRTNKPTITRASYQWFIDTNSLKEKAIESIQDIRIYPPHNSIPSLNALNTQLKQRPFWCISRQRSWGTPIPVLYQKSTGKIITSRSWVERLCRLIDEHHEDFWWELPLEKLVGRKLLKEMDVDVDDLIRGEDILDIWFDSGISWSKVLPEGTTADLYMEGMDQFNGWFQSSLITSVALKGSAPYKAIFVHGFAVDERQTKMSKSVGNVIDPEIIMKGGKDLNKNPVYGVDALRWWVASHGCQHSQVPVSEPILRESLDCINKIRLILRFLLGALHSYTVNKNVEARYSHLDRYLLHKLFDFNEKVESFYDSYQYHHVCKAVLNFTTNDVSALYCHHIKDRLYCDSATAPHRIGILDVLDQILTVLTRSIAPIVPHLAEEVWLHYPDNLASVPLFHAEFKAQDTWKDLEIEEIMKRVFSVKEQIRQSGIKNTWHCNAIVTANAADYSYLKKLQEEEVSVTSELCDMLQVASIQLQSDTNIDNTNIQLKNINKELCIRCRRYSVSSNGTLCERCMEVLNTR